LKLGLSYSKSNPKAHKPLLLIYCQLESRILFLLWHYLESAHKPTNQQYKNSETSTVLFYIKPNGQQIRNIFGVMKHSFSSVPIFGISPQAYKPSISILLNEDCLRGRIHVRIPVQMGIQIRVQFAKHLISRTIQIGAYFKCVQIRIPFRVRIAAN
jgi:hypothetical protein